METFLPILGLDIYAHGTHLVTALTTSWQGWRVRPRIRTFDFGRRGCGILPLWDEVGGGSERKATFVDGSEFAFEAARAGGVGSCGRVGSLGDGAFFQVSYFSYSATSSWAEGLTRCR